MHQPILVNADVHESPECGDIRHHAFQHHLGLEVLQLLDALLKARRLELRPWIAARLLQLRQDVGHSRNTKFLVREVDGSKRA
jgi:hypothetical protein